MKKFIFISIFLSLFLFFSCASKSSQEENSSPDAPENTEQAAENQDLEQSQTSEAEQYEAFDDSENSETESETKQEPLPSDEYEIPEEIDEPVIRDLPAEEKQPEEEPVKEIEPVETVVEEPVRETDIDVLEPVPESLNAEDKTEDAQSVSENTDDITASNSDDENVSAEDASDNGEIIESEKAAEQNAEEETGDTEEKTEDDEEIIIPTRTVTMNIGESLEIVYPGNGWIYMGSLSEYNNLASKGRKLGAQDTKYTLLAKSEGTQIHHFYKNDNLTKTFIDDYIEVVVTAKKGSSKTVVKAPEYQYVVPEKAQVPAKSSKTIKAEKEAGEKAAAEKAMTVQAETDSESKTTVKASEGKPDENKVAGTEKQTAASEMSNGSAVQTAENTDVSNSVSDSSTVTSKAPDSSTRTSASSSITPSSSSASSRTPKVSEKKSMEYVPEAEITSVYNNDDALGAVDEVTDYNSDDISVEDTESQIDTNALLEQAKALFDKKEYKQAELVLTDFFEYATEKRDEALYLQGQILEADGSTKNIRGAISAYENLTQNYPASKYWDKANKRIVYLKRFYVDIH